MARFTSPDVQFETEDGRTFTIRMSVKAWAALQDHWGLENLDQAAARLADMESGKLHALDLGTVLWAAMRTHHPEVSQDEALEVLDGIGIPALMHLMAQCAAASLPNQEGGGKASANPPRRLWSLGR